MCLFKKKKKEIKAKECFWWDEQWKRIKHDYPIGIKFDYLGRQMIVVSHDEYRAGVNHPALPYLPTQYPAVQCEYADMKGKLHEWTFGVDLFDLLESL